MTKAFFKKRFLQGLASTFHFKRDRDIPRPGDPHYQAKLDDKYASILTSLSPQSWSITKQMLAVGLGSQGGLLRSTGFTALPVIFGLEEAAIYNVLLQLRPVTELSSKRGCLSFHPSFVEYLMDPTRSKAFYIDADELCDDLVRRLAKIALEKPWKDDWSQITPGVSGKKKADFLSMLKLDAERALRYSITGELKTQRGRGPFVSQTDRSECLDFLCEVNTVDFLDDGFWLVNFMQWLIRLWDCFPQELQQRGVVKVVLLRDLRVDHLGQGYGRHGVAVFGSAPTHLDITKTVPLFRNWLCKEQNYPPKKKVLIVGSTPEKRSAILCHASEEQTEYCYMRYPY